MLLLQGGLAVTREPQATDQGARYRRPPLGRIGCLVVLDLRQEQLQRAALGQRCQPTAVLPGSGMPRVNTCRPSCGRRSSHSVAARRRARSISCRRSASASLRAARASGCGAGSSSRARSWVSVAAIITQSCQRAGEALPLARSARPAAIAAQNASISARMDSRAKSSHLRSPRQHWAGINPLGRQGMMAHELALLD